APSMPEAMKQIRNDLGADAVILNSKEIKVGGFLGFFKQKKIEVIAALDEMEVSQVERREKQVTRPVEPPTQEAHKNLDHSAVLEEIKHVQKLLSFQQGDRTNEFAPVFEHVYTYLQDQEVEQAIAQQIVKKMIAN